MNSDSPVTRADFDEFREEMRGQFKELREYIDVRTQELREYIDERTHDAETRLLRGFADYNDSANIRFRKLEADTSNIDASTTQRLGELERQMTDFKMRLIALESQRPRPS